MDQTVVINIDKASSQQVLSMKFDQSAERNDDLKQAGSECGQLLSESRPQSHSPDPLNLACNSTTSFADAKFGKSSNCERPKCVICAGVANGYHFGALSCAACNAFFRRSIAESRKYFCRQNGHCIVDQSARCFCRACRLKKCLERGMDPSAVQPHRDMVGQKRRRIDEDCKDDPETSGINSEITSISDLEIEETIDVVGNGGENFPTEKTAEDRVVVPEEPILPCNTSACHPHFVPDANDSSKRPKYNDSSTPQPLSSVNFFAESLIALSKNPLIGPACGGVPTVAAIGLAQNQQNAELFEAARRAGVMKFPNVAPAADALKIANASLLSSYFSNLVDGRKPLNTQFSPAACFAQPLSSSRSESNFKQVPASPSGSFRSAEIPTRCSSVASSTKKATKPSAPKAPYDPSKNTIEVLINLYVRLVERMRLLFSPGNLRDLLAAGEPPARRIDFCEHLTDMAEPYTALLIEFVNNIQPFPKLRLDDRVAVAKHSFFPLFMLDRHYRTMLRGGLQANRIFRPDFTYYDLSCIEIDEDAPGTSSQRLWQPVGNSEKREPPRMDLSAFRRAVIPAMRESVREVTGAMYYSGTTDAEFVALVTAVVLDPNAPNLSNVAKRMLKEARDRLYSEWFAYYEAHNITNAAERVGNALLLLPAVYAAAKQSMENFHMLRIFNLCDLSALLDDLIL